MSDVDATIAEIEAALVLPSGAFIEGLGRAVANHVGGQPALRADTLNIERLSGINAGTAGVWGITGTTDRGEPYSLVLKALQVNPDAAHFDLWGPVPGPPSDPWYWKREAESYESGILASPGIHGVRSPNYFGDLPPGEPGVLRHGIFLERVNAIPGTQLGDRDFAAVAKRLGAMQGHFLLAHLAGTDLRQGWLADGYPREYVNRVGKMMDAPEAANAWNDPATWANPILEPFQAVRQDGPPLRDAVMQLWESRDAYLRLFESNPALTLSHQDLWQGQIAIAEDGTLLLDFASLGRAPIGADLAKLGVEIAAQSFRPGSEWAPLEESLRQAYLEGLAEAGVDTSKPLVGKLVDLGWSSWVAAMETYRLKVDWVPLAADGERAQVVKLQWGGRSEETVFQRYAERTEQVLRRADMARTLADDPELKPYLAGTKKLTTADLVERPRSRAFSDPRSSSGAAVTPAAPAAVGTGAAEQTQRQTR